MTKTALDMETKGDWYTFYKSFNRRFKRILDESPQTLTEACELLGFTYSAIEKRRNDIWDYSFSTKILKRLGDCYGVSLDWLFDVKYLDHEYIQTLEDKEGKSVFDFEDEDDWREYYSTVINKVRTVFKNTQETPTSFASFLGVETTTVYDWLKKDNINIHWTARRLKKLADYFGVSLDWLFDIKYTRVRYRNE